MEGRESARPAATTAYPTYHQEVTESTVAQELLHMNCVFYSSSMVLSVIWREKSDHSLTWQGYESVNNTGKV